MNIHDEFYNHLGTLSDKNELQTAYGRYKESSFELNGRLKSGLPLGDLLELNSQLQKTICAKSNCEVVLYRMTSRTEFTGSILDVLEGKIFTYSAYMSTSRSPEKIHSFTPKYDPVVLEITCPTGTTMALMEAKQGANEDEYLLGCGTKFKIGIPSQPSTATEYTGLRSYNGVLTILPLTVVRNPPYATNSINFFPFS